MKRVGPGKTWLYHRIEYICEECSAEAVFTHLETQDFVENMEFQLEKLYGEVTKVDRRVDKFLVDQAKIVCETLADLELLL